jgi:hypothetical protein
MLLLLLLLLLHDRSGIDSSMLQPLVVRNPGDVVGCIPLTGPLRMQRTQ